MGNLYRAQILLEREQHKALKDIAQEEGRSLSEVMREIVDQFLAGQEQALQKQRELQALQDLANMRQQIWAQHGPLRANLLAEARAEWEQDVERIWAGEE
jgi:hypothetical protein